MKLPQESLRLVLQAPLNKDTEQIFKDIRDHILTLKLSQLPARKSILKIEVIQPVFAVMRVLKKPRTKKKLP